MDLATAQAKLQAYLDAEAAILEGQTVSLDGFSYSLPDLDSIRDGINHWSQVVTILQAQAASPTINPTVMTPRFRR